ncbi:MAG: hypothetical protein SPI15_11660, partial [Candidatus Faecousia sp.]|nr:hypothetical protein [Candidatus Faecousia sp.]
QTCCVFPDCMGRKQISPILISQASPDSFPPGEAKALRAAILQTTIYLFQMSKSAKKSLTFPINSAIILQLPKTAGAARRKSCRGALNKNFLRVFLSSGRKTLFIFGGENYAQRKGS